MDYTSRYMSPLGYITLASDGEALIGLWFEGQKHFALTLTNESSEDSDLPVFEQTRNWLDLYFSGECPTTFYPRRTKTFNKENKAMYQVVSSLKEGQRIAASKIDTVLKASLRELFCL